MAVGGRGTLVGAALGAIIVNLGKTILTGALPEVWLFALGLLFLLVTMFLPKGLLGLYEQWRRTGQTAEPCRSRAAKTSTWCRNRWRACRSPKDRPARAG